ncbi:hypothetical protein ACO0LG_08750 [Undibacterium sp. Ji42W]|uniref:hypothetical protein n=1 Tax=Undibacterium sp. Ji42W TaxID=3413039 RepID=UPI003BF35A90
MANMKQSIPGLSNMSLELQRVLIPMKQNIEIITGTAIGMKPLDQLAGTATLSDAINKINEIIVRLNQSGQ